MLKIILGVSIIKIIISEKFINLSIKLVNALSLSLFLILLIVIIFKLF